MNGAAQLIEQRSTAKVSARAALSPKLVFDLIRRRLFILAIGADISASVLQVLALRVGALALVQPLLVLSLLLAVVIASVTVKRHPPDRVMLAGASCCVGGIACFMAIARPHGDARTVGIGVALPITVSLAAVLAACAAAARWGPRARRPLWLALACGVDFGVIAFLFKVIPDTVTAGFTEPLRQWPLYMAVIVIPVGFLLNLDAFEGGTRLASALAIITTVDPLASIVCGTIWLHERITDTVLALAGEAVALVLTIGGVIALARRAPRLQHQETDTRNGPPCPKQDGPPSVPRTHEPLVRLPDVQVGHRAAR